MSDTITAPGRTGHDGYRNQRRNLLGQLGERLFGDFEAEPLTAGHNYAALFDTDALSAPEQAHLDGLLSAEVMRLDGRMMTVADCYAERQYTTVEDRAVLNEFGGFTLRPHLIASDGHRVRVEDVVAKAVRLPNTTSNWSIAAAATAEAEAATTAAAAFEQKAAAAVPGTHPQTSASKKASHLRTVAAEYRAAAAKHLHKEAVTEQERLTRVGAPSRALARAHAQEARTGAVLTAAIQEAVDRREDELFGNAVSSGVGPVMIPRYRRTPNPA